MHAVSPDGHRGSYKADRALLTSAATGASTPHEKNPESTSSSRCKRTGNQYVGKSPCGQHAEDTLRMQGHRTGQDPQRCKKHPAQSRQPALFDEMFWRTGAGSPSPTVPSALALSSLPEVQCASSPAQPE